jgi:dimethylamine/trimethylamine dehydrogenase
VARDARYDVLFEPVRIGPKTLRNRFYQTPHEPGFGVLVPWTAARYRGMKAEGGWAAVCTGFAPISPEGDSSFHGRASRMWDEGDVRAFSLMCDEVHERGALAGIELHHGGVHQNNESRVPAVAPSQLAGDGISAFVVPMAMEKSDIRRVQADWVAAARRAVSAGFDIVYVYGAHSYLPMQFLSPFYNQRTDEYGGTLENRARFWLETIEVIKDAVGDESAIAVRISVDDLTAPTVSADEALEFISIADELVDLWDVNVASISEWAKDAGSSRFFGEGHELPWIGRVHEVATKPIVGVSRWTSPDRMAEVVASGVLDLIGAARQTIADPFLPRKIEEGRLDDIRECIGANQCLTTHTAGMILGCSQNATAGEEYRRDWHPERFEPAANADNDVLVVGAGPAGMECALVLARRGMRRVHLVDVEGELGGHLRWWSQLPGFGQWARVTNYRRIQLDKLRNVEFVPGTRLDAAAIRDYGADIVVCATGATWSPAGLNGFTRQPIPGADPTLPYVLTPEQVMVEGKRPPGRHLVVYDCDGYLLGGALAEKLVDEGYEVELLTPFSVVSPYAWLNEAPIIRKHLHTVGVAERREVTLTAIEAGSVLGIGEYGDTIEIETDAVLLVTQRVSNDDLYRALLGEPEALAASGIAAVYRVGDCVAPRMLREVVFDGHRLAREIDSSDPSLAKPFAREGATHRAESLTTA